MKKMAVFEAQKHNAEQVVEMIGILAAQEGVNSAFTWRKRKGKRWGCSRFPSARTCSTAHQPA